MAVLIVSLTLFACSKRDNEAICQRAHDHFNACVRQSFGEERYIAAKLRERHDVEQCTGDDETVVMYEKCLKETDCGQFESCLITYLSEHGP